MSTSALIVARREGGDAARFVATNGHPEYLGSLIAELVESCQGDFVRVFKRLVDDAPHGWLVCPARRQTDPVQAWGEDGMGEDLGLVDYIYVVEGKKRRMQVFESNEDLDFDAPDSKVTFTKPGEIRKKPKWFVPGMLATRPTVTTELSQAPDYDGLNAAIEAALPEGYDADGLDRILTWAVRGWTSRLRGELRCKEWFVEVDDHGAGFTQRSVGGIKLWVPDAGAVIVDGAFQIYNLEGAMRPLMTPFDKRVSDRAQGAGLGDVFKLRQALEPAVLRFLGMEDPFQVLMDGEGKVFYEIDGDQVDDFEVDGASVQSMAALSLVEWWASRG